MQPNYIQITYICFFYSIHGFGRLLRISPKKKRKNEENQNLAEKIKSSKNNILLKNYKKTIFVSTKSHELVVLRKPKTSEIGKIFHFAIYYRFFSFCRYISLQFKFYSQESCYSGSRLFHLSAWSINKYTKVRASFIEKPGILLRFSTYPAVVSWASYYT